MKIKPLFIKILLIIIFPFSVASETRHNFMLEVEIPKLKVSEYHAPYVASWIENDSRKVISATSLWYDEQEKWLKDIRQWWRKTGRTQSKPYDGVTGATRRPGMHKLKLHGQDIINQLTPGNYVLFIEAAREVGGREVLKIPFSWPIESNTLLTTQGQHELGKVTLSITSNQ